MNTLIYVVVYEAYLINKWEPHVARVDSSRKAAETYAETMNKNPPKLGRNYRVVTSIVDASVNQ